MKYSKVVPGIFIKRPNRFIAHIMINGNEEICHVKNTGRCKELLIPGCTVYCSVSDNPQRKTKFDLIAVEKILNFHTRVAAETTSEANSNTSLAPKDKRKSKTNNTLLVNMDSQAPNAAVKEWLASGASPFGQIDFLKPECKHGNSRFDFYLEIKEQNTLAKQNEIADNSSSQRIGNDHKTIDAETNQILKSKTRKIFVEVKGVTLEQDSVVLFPDAPTERGVKHVHELIQCHGEGYETYILFVVQMNHASYFTPNRKTHPQFADALCEAKQAGVQLLAYTCKITPDEMVMDKPLPIKL
ncbi:MAG: DNA/RNA nuclease SfsA [Acidaminococcaceae bacterium]|nr:DNA/RNA nuclease SfsA [Acidaminococcaceae bacterium]MBO5638251.1 DNA/RNA nuclease SfsA [Acidaminococcaceae bacterium]